MVVDTRVTKIECSNGLAKLCTPENTESYWDSVGWKKNLGG